MVQSGLSKNFSATEEIFRHLIDSVEDYAIFVIDREGKILTWNKGAEKIKGYCSNEIIGRHISLFYSPEDIESGEPMQNLRLAAECGHLEKEGWRVRKDGLRLWANIIFTPLRDNEGNIWGFAKVTRDISEKKKVDDRSQNLEEYLRVFNNELERQVKLKNRQLTDIFERITDGFISLDKDFCYTYVNQRTGELLRKAPRDLLGMCIWEVFPDLVDTPTYHALIQSLKEQRFVCVLGHDQPLGLWQEYHIYPSPDGLSVFIRDVSRQKKDEMILKNSEEKYRLLFENNPMPMWIISLPERDFLDVNNAAMSHYGYQREDFVGKNVRQMLVMDSSVEAEIQQANEFNPGEISHRSELRHRKKDGTILQVESKTFDIFYENKPARLVLCHDVTENVKAQKKVLETTKQLRELSAHLQKVREDERAHVAREIHDELGQQLTAMKMDLAFLLKRAKPEDPAGAQKLQSIQELLNRSIKTVRKIATELRPSILDDLGLVAAVEWQCVEFSKRSGVDVQFFNETVDLVYDGLVSIGLFRICQESLTNVARYAQATEVKVWLRQAPEKLVLTIKDNGIGFDTRTREGKKTWGLLGMKERARIMGGDLIISSERKKGTSIEVSVPLANPQTTTT